MTKDNYDNLYSLLKQYNQEHILTFWDQLSDEEKTSLINDIHEINFEQFIKDVEEAKDKSAKSKIEKVDNILEPPPKDICGSLLTSPDKEIEHYESLGLESISRGEYCAILMAGGAGTRLGVSYPKGMYSVDLPSQKSLFQIQAERLLRLQNMATEQYGSCRSIMWYIMTSECTRDGTVEFFSKNNYFGLKKEQIEFFEQFTLPVMGVDGRILMSSKSRIAKSPDGNGGLYRSMANYKLLDHMNERGVKYAFVYGVDNILVKIADPIFLGFCRSKGVECAAKVVEKTRPNEAVGVVGVVAGKFQVVEYSEINPETAALKDESSVQDNTDNDNKDDTGPTYKLLYRSANICTHLFHISFLERVCQDNNLLNMPQHIALKKVPNLNIKTEVLETPTSINGIKMEKFVFDVFPSANSFAIWEVDRNEEFSPLKNAPGTGSDCPETSRESLLALHRKYILQCVEKYNPELREKIQDKLAYIDIEISPLVSYRGENLSDAVVLLANSSEGLKFSIDLSKNNTLELKRV